MNYLYCLYMSGIILFCVISLFIGSGLLLLTYIWVKEKLGNVMCSILGLLFIWLFVATLIFFSTGG
jgi:hypothetical protein